ncbi:MAG: OB-fold domain-containing protein [Chloroflexota bacterium]|nr:MAG: OB-fold domain-containing protein [Chloroflexota bacterium]
MKTITAYKCNKCGHVMYPRHERCLNCNKRDFKEINPTKNGKLLTYSIVNELPWGIDERGRVLGIVEFDNGIRVMGRVKSDRVKIGMKLTASWEEVRFINGVKVYGLTFY